MKNKLCYFLSPLLFMALLHPAFATPLSTLISTGGNLQVGNLLFENFGVINGAEPDGIEVLGFTNSSGDFGLTFTPNPPFAIASGGSNEIIGDVVFDVSVTSQNSAIHGITQQFTAGVSGSGIAAFDFTRVGPPHTMLGTVAASCINGDFPGCPQIQGPVDSANLATDVSSTEVEREVQLVRNRGGNGTGTLSSWNVAFAQTSAGTPAPVPEPAPAILLGAGLTLLGYWKFRT